MAKIFVNDVGTDFIVSSCADLTGFRSASLFMFDPTGASEIWDASLSGAASNGMVKHNVSASSLLTPSGTWKGNLGVTVGSAQYTGETFGFILYDKWTY
jgi:hypothetical protein